MVQRPARSTPGASTTTRSFVLGCSKTSSPLALSLLRPITQAGLRSPWATSTRFSFPVLRLPFGFLTALAKGEVYGCGSNRANQVGRPATNQASFRFLTPTLVGVDPSVQLSNIVKVSAGQYHNLALSGTQF